MTTNYVRGASISSSAFRAEIQAMLTVYGAAGFRCGLEDGRAAIVFIAGKRQFRFILPLTGPVGSSSGTTGDPLQPRSSDTAGKAKEDAARRQWHQLSLLIRAKLDAVAAGITTFDQEFLAYMVLPGGTTVFDAVTPAVSNAYTPGGRPPLSAT
ncbi:hypothetical protein KIH31_04190 [Paenarthrobacter sp. DKR-5]|uniref:hypothetical protein n=1 Tax=Paenarthrobacter sp. DKR-5 TaxID=2835535 RepID=UPI001BDD5892|nr:hypothetical protein [Paenarthrobacter sp. DKR-5]MBT1001794.1 hypothetical protein [Paenarthrobacter sp. DKR-5]